MCSIAGSEVWKGVLLLYRTADVENLLGRMSWTDVGLLTSMGEDSRVLLTAVG